jgi:C2H2 type zinc-finger (2 copies)
MFIITANIYFPLQAPCSVASLLLHGFMTSPDAPASATGRGAGPAVAAAGFTVKPPQRPNSISTDTAVASTDTSTSAGGMASASASAVGRKWHAAGGRARPYHSGRGAEDSDGDDDESGWETASASDDGDAAAASAGAHADEEGDVEPVPEDEADWVEWDVCRSLFDNHISGSLADNLRYMQRRFGFSLPEPDRLRDTEGLIKYLGAKLQYGRVRCSSCVVVDGSMS